MIVQPVVEPIELYTALIRTLKRPVPRIESPGFPGTQWSEFYWKDQTVIYFKCFN